MRTFKEYLILALKGSGMGAADVIPGVSGGTIAFLMGIYQQLLDSIKSINEGNIQYLNLFNFPVLRSRSPL